MNPLNDLPVQLLACLLLGVACFILMLIVVGVGKAWRHAWAWVDDSEPGRNPVLETLAKLRGWTQYDPNCGSSKCLWWTDRKGETKTDAVLFFFPLIVGAPLAIYLSIKLYPLLVAALTLLAVAFVARFARRHKKLFDKHLKDPKAHK